MAKETKMEDTPSMVEKPITDLAVLGDITPVAERPKSLDSSDLDGTEDIRPDEIQLPRLAIAQGLSPQLVPGEGQYIKGLAIGELFNDVSEEIFGKGPLTIVPVKRHVTRIEFDPNDKKVPLDRNVPAGDPRLEWTASTPGGKKDTPPRATEFVEFTSLLLRPGKRPEALVVSIKTTNKQQRAAAKLWTTYIGTRGGTIYSGMYNVSSDIIKGQNKKGEPTMYGVFIVKNAGFVPKDTPAGAALFNFAKEFAAVLKDKTVVTAREGDDDDLSFDTNAMDAQSAEANKSREMV